MPTNSHNSAQYPQPTTLKIGTRNTEKENVKEEPRRAAHDGGKAGDLLVVTPYLEVQSYHQNHGLHLERWLFWMKREEGRRI
ncbi:hypothetical protein QL285_023342 [Trifolium repens]|nr:hypothetical protein QL285_023342 [Trifolium repens]